MTDTQTRRERLLELYERIRLSMPTELVDGRYDGDFLHPVFGDGNPHAALMLLGEAPGAEEAAAGRPFVGKAGRQLDELLADARVEREDVYITNVVKYRPVVKSLRSVRNRTPSTGEIASALPLLAEEICLMQPVCIATLGNTPLRAVMTLADLPFKTIGSCHGHLRHITVFGQSILLYPLYHPASGIYNRALIEVMHADAHALGEHLVKLGR